MENVNKFDDHGPAYLAKQLANVRQSVDALERVAMEQGREGQAAVELRKTHQQLERLISEMTD